MAVKTTDMETGISIENGLRDLWTRPFKEWTSHTACSSQNLTINMPASAAPTMQPVTVTVPSLLLCGGTGVPASAPPSMASGGLQPLNFSLPVHPATPSGFSALMPEPNANLRAVMNGANSASKTPVRSRMPAPGVGKISMKPLREAKPKASKRNISLRLPCKITSVYMYADKAEVAEGEEKKI
eukprot:3796707-Rhodomonas_salina.1